MLVAMEKLLKSEEELKKDPFSEWDIVCDNIFGVDDSPCEKVYTVNTGFILKLGPLNTDLTCP